MGVDDDDDDDDDDNNSMLKYDYKWNIVFTCSFNKHNDAHHLFLMPLYSNRQLTLIYFIKLLSSSNLNGFKA